MDGPQTTSPRIVPAVVREHVERAAFFWAQRDTLAEADPPDTAVIAGVDRRLEANLDGLRIAGAAAWPFALQQMEDFQEKGELFVVALMAIELRDEPGIELAIGAGQSQESPRGLVGALAWLRPEAIGPLVRDWIVSADPFRRFLGVAACVAHRVDPKAMLGRLLKDGDARVRAQASRLAGLLERRDLAAELRAGLSDRDAAVRFEAAKALAAIGAGAAAELRRVATGGGPDALDALRVVVKAGPDADVRAWMGSLLRVPATAATAVRGAGMLGDRKVRGWLVDRMADPLTATAAAAAFLELHGPVDNREELFLSDEDLILERFGQAFADLGRPVPLPEQFRALLDAETAAASA